MKITGDLTNPWLIHAKGMLFVVLGLLAAFLIWAQLPTLKTAALLVISIWAFCRFYYYLFYVLERYLGKDRRFAGVMQALRSLRTAKGKKSMPSAAEHVE